MCDCGEHVRSQEYQNQVTLPSPFTEGKFICIDTCLEDEIKMLWKLGIKTNGCCCGHNYLLPYIGVYDKDVDRMIELGYIIHVNPNGKDNLLRKDSFYPKSVKLNMAMYDNYFEHLYKQILK